MATIERYQNTSGATLWRVRWRTPDKRDTQKRGFKTKRDAALFAATLEVSKARGEYIAPTVGKTTVGALGPAWLARQRGHMKASGFRVLRQRLAGARAAQVGTDSYRRGQVLRRAGVGSRHVRQAWAGDCADGL